MIETLKDYAQDIREENKAQRTNFHLERKSCVGKKTGSKAFLFYFKFSIVFFSLALTERKGALLSQRKSHTRKLAHSRRALIFKQSFGLARNVAST